MLEKKITPCSGRRVGLVIAWSSPMLSHRNFPVSSTPVATTPQPVHGLRPRKEGLAVGSAAAKGSREAGARGTTNVLIWHLDVGAPAPRDSCRTEAAPDEWLLAGMPHSPQTERSALDLRRACSTSYCQRNEPSRPVWRHPWRRLPRSSWHDVWRASALNISASHEGSAW